MKNRHFKPRDLLIVQLFLINSNVCTITHCFFIATLEKVSVLENCFSTEMMGAKLSF